MTERRLRLATGLVMAAYVIPHVLNQALGIVSLPAMDAFHGWYGPIFRTIPGSIILYSAFLVHFVLTLRALYQRTELRMPPAEAIRLGVGLLIAPIVATHVVGIRLWEWWMGTSLGYPGIIGGIWRNGAFGVVTMGLFTLSVWVHLVIGLHYWLKVHARYRRLVPLLYPLSVVVPVLAFVGYSRALMTASAALADPAWSIRVWGPPASIPAELIPTIDSWRNGMSLFFLGAVVVVFIARQVRESARRRRGVFRITLPSGRVLTSPLGRTVLEVLRAARTPHAAVCGGQGRCTTCRVAVRGGLEQLDDPNETERDALERIKADPGVRLACQVRPRSDLDVVPLIAANATARDANLRGGMRGREQQVVIMFIDLRGSTKLGEERLPYDVLFILNQFFAEMASALTETGGHYAQFSGDGLMALYGIEGDFALGCREAIAGARVMHERLGRLNERLRAELQEPLRMGIGIHGGDAIVGTMGPPDAPNFSAIGDNVNIAARLEQMTKDKGCAIIISAVVAEASGLAFGDSPHEDVGVRGRDEPVTIYRFGSAANLPG